MRFNPPLALLTLLTGGIDLVGPVTAAAQTRPLQTETAATAAAGTLVFESGFDLIGRQPSYITGRERTFWEGPLLRLVYSPADNVELDLEWVARVGVWNEEGRGPVASSDWGDVSLRAKWRIRPERDGRPAFGVRFAVTLPETQFEDDDRRPLGLGPNTQRASIEALLTRPLGPGRLHVNAGFAIQEEVLVAHDQRDFFAYGLAYDWPATRRATLLAEIAGRAGPGTPGAEERAEARLGLRFGRGRLRGDVGLRRGLKRIVGLWGVTAGLAWER